MRIHLMASALMILWLPGLMAELPPIKPEVWEVKEAETKGFGAIILERTIKFHATSVEHAYLIRVLNEQGRNAVEFPKFLPASTIEGRTIARGGVETPFKASSDFQTKALVETGKGSLDRTSVTPPGLTPDCVVQVQWTERAFFGAAGPFWDYQVQDRVFSLGARLPTRRLELEVYDDLAWGYDLQTGPRGAQIVTGKGFRKAIFKEIPAYEWVPYSEESAKDNPRFVLYQQPRYLVEASQKGEKVFWEEVANHWYRPFYDRKIQYGKVWGAFSDEIRQGLPPSRQAAALELHRRLLARFLDVTALTPEELAARSEKQNKRKIDPRDFGEVLKTGETTGAGLHLLLWSLLGSAGIPAKPVFMVDRRERKLRPKECNIAQLGDWVLMIEEEGAPPIFIEPARRFAPPDLILPKFQGTEALALVPVEPKWGYQVVKVPIQDGSRNTQVVKVTTIVGEDRDQIHLTSNSTGIKDWEERAQWWSMLPAERNKNLKEILEKRDAAVQIETATVGPYKKGPFEWRCDAVRERDATRHIEVNPFPLVDPPMDLPRDLPAQRQERIALPQLGLQEYQATIVCPQGFVWSGAPPIQRSNTFGEVSWTAGPGDSPSEIRVLLKVRTTTLLAEPSSYPEFKTFLAWVREGFSRTLILSRSSS